MDRHTTHPSRQPRFRTFHAWANYRDYRLLWIANFCANSAQWLQLLSVGWLIRNLTADSDYSALLVITAGGLLSPPILIVGPWAGVLGDRVDKRKLIMVTQACMAVVSVLFAILVSTGQHEVWHAYAYVLVGGTARSITHPMQFALISGVVSRRDFPNAYATNVFTITVTRIVGPFVGGVLIASLGFVWNFAIEAALYAGVVLSLATMRTPYTSPPTAGQNSPMADLKEGVRYIWKGEKSLSQIMVLQVVPNVLLHPLYFLLPVFTSEVLGRGPDFGGYLLATTGFGGLIATVVIASGGFNSRRGLISLTTVGVSSVGAILFAQSQWILPSFILMGLFAYSQSTFRTTTGTMVQLLSPDHLRGRITSLQRYVEGFLPFSSVLIGLFAWRTSAPLAMTVVGIVGLALAVIFSRVYVQLRTEA